MAQSQHRSDRHRRDGTGVIRSMLREENAIWVSIATSPQILHLVVEKGSVCIDGISLTVAKVDEAGFQVSVIPHTGEETTLLKKVPGDLVNLENDVVGKYIEKLLGIRKNEEEKTESGITMSFLRNSGFRTGGYTLCHKTISTTQLKRH